MKKYWAHLVPQPVRHLFAPWGPLPRWTRRIILERRRGACICRLEDFEYYEWRPTHPTPRCPLRNECVPTPPCGGCDRCIGDQVVYYREKAARK